MAKGKILHTFTVRGRPVALDDQGAVHAVELGYFPVSSTGYRSMYYWREDPPELTEDLLAKLQEELEKQAKEEDKEKFTAAARAKECLKKKYSDQVCACISLSGALDRVVDHAFFAETKDQESLLRLALQVAEKLASLPRPETLDHYAWKVEDVWGEIDKAARQVEALRKSLSAGHLVAIAESRDFVGTGVYLDLYQGRRPDEPSTVPDRRRLGKAYLIGRDKSFIWRGHYTHDPSLSAWGMTEEIEDAYRFASLEEACDYWRSRHTFPEEYEHCIWDGYLTFFEETKKGIRRVVPKPEQPSLF